MLDELYSNAYIYTLPSDLEGMPLSLLEAMSYGNCCLVSDIPECAEVVEDKALIFQKSNVEDLQEKLQDACDHPEMVMEMKKHAADFICKKYNWDEVVKETMKLYQKGEALEKLIREARFSIYPSEWYENCPFSVMESQMYGTPVLGAEIGGIPELIQVGMTGELFESGNAEDLKKKIEKLWGDKKLCEKYSKNCKDISFDTIDEYYEKIMKVYR